jgi:hypothetical protein
MNQRALEDMVDWQCFACGRLNEHGLRIKSYWSGEDVVCTWRPDPLYVGHPERLHAGLVATIMLCHLAWAATALAHRRLNPSQAETRSFSSNSGSSSKTGQRRSTTAMGSVLMVAINFWQAAVNSATLP